MNVFFNEKKKDFMEEFSRFSSYFSLLLFAVSSSFFAEKFSFDNGCDGGINDGGPIPR